MILVDLSGAIRDIVQADITEDIAGGLFGYDVLRLAPDDDGKLGFPIELNAGIGPRRMGSEGPVSENVDFRKTSGSVGVGTLSSSMCFL